MVPDPDTQLAVVIKALRDVVAPAVDPANQLAMEQLQLSIATLGLVKSWIPLEHRRARRELSNAIDLARKVRDAWAGAGLDDAIEQASALLADSHADALLLDRIRAQLLSGIEAAVAQAAGSPSEQAVARAVIVGSRPQFDLARAFCRPAGFDGDADGSRPLSQLLSG